MLTFWAKTSGTWINLALVLIGTGCGLLLRNRLSLKMRVVITQATGLITLFIGLSMAQTLTTVKAGGVEGVILALVALVAGGLLGEWWQVEDRLTDAGNWLKARFRGGSRFTEGFVAASLLFCIGPMAILGSLNNGLLGDSHDFGRKGYDGRPRLDCAERNLWNWRRILNLALSALPGRAVAIGRRAGSVSSRSSNCA